MEMEAQNCVVLFFILEQFLFIIKSPSFFLPINPNSEQFLPLKEKHLIKCTRTSFLLQIKLLFNPLKSFQKPICQTYYFLRFFPKL